MEGSRRLSPSSPDPLGRMLTAWWKEGQQLPEGLWGSCTIDGLPFKLDLVRKGLGRARRLFPASRSAVKFLARWGQL